MRAICAALAFLFAYVVVDAHLDRQVTFSPPTTHDTTVGPTRSDR